MKAGSQQPRARAAFVLGGARSGKSLYAEILTSARAPERLYLATAALLDDEMRARAALHRDRRDGSWRTLEEPLDIAPLIAREAAPGRALLVDCLTLWLSNVMFAERDIAAETAALIGAMRAARGPVILVSNEIGLGLVPETALGRRFRDAQGRLNQAVAAAADDVAFVAAGLPLWLKGAA